MIAEDSNGDVAAKRVEMNLTINVLDENDSPPEFLNTSYIFSIPENCDSHTSVGQVSVTDDDVSGVGNVQFRIIHGDDEKFYIETMYGECYICWVSDLIALGESKYKLNWNVFIAF